MHTNNAKAKIKAGEAVFGCLTRTNEATLVEFLAYMGFDFLILDAEHGYLQPRECENMIRALEPHGVTSLVRVTTNAPHLILRFLDTGAQGLMVPQVNSAAEAEAAMQAMKFTPRGRRGLAGTRSAHFLQGISIPEHVEQANNETLAMLQIESKEAVEDLENILAVSDIDVLFIGRTDLSQSYGVPGQNNHPDVVAAVDRVFELTENTDVAVGMLVGDAKEARQWQERGAKLLATTLDKILGPACKSFLADARG